MRSPILPALVVALLPTVSQADGNPEAGTSRPTVIVKEGDCRLLTRHHPLADVSATAIDAYGRPVVPAEEGGSFRPPRLRFIIQAPAIERETWRSEPALMELTLDLDTGEITSGGHPVRGLSETDLVKACSENLSEPRSAP